MADQFSRSALLLGADGINKLKDSRVAVFGIGGVGGYTVEALARSGVGALDLIDNDRVCLTNLNRQIIALHSTVGRYKTEVARERLLDINPEIRLTIHNVFYLPETAELFDFSAYDYVVDAIDTVSGKIALVEAAAAAGVPIISSMGAGNKLDPTRFEVADIYETSVCPLARVMRRELKKRGIQSLKVVYSKEKPLTPFYPENQSGTGGAAGSETPETKGTAGRPAPGSLAFVPSVAGLILAGEVVKDLVTREE